MQSVPRNPSAHCTLLCIINFTFNLDPLLQLLCPTHFHTHLKDRAVWMLSLSTQTSRVLAMAVKIFQYNSPNLWRHFTTHISVVLQILQNFLLWAFHNPMRWTEEELLWLLLHDGKNVASQRPSDFQASSLVSGRAGLLDSQAHVTYSSSFELLRGFPPATFPAYPAFIFFSWNISQIAISKNKEGNLENSVNRLLWMKCPFKSLWGLHIAFT